MFDRVALRNDSYTLHKILPNKVDPLVSLMMVEKVPDSTYEMVGGLDKQIKEIKEVIELPVKHPELFDALGIAQPKGEDLGPAKYPHIYAIHLNPRCAAVRTTWDWQDFASQGCGPPHGVHLHQVGGGGCGWGVHRECSECQDPSWCRSSSEKEVGW